MAVLDHGVEDWEDGHIISLSSEVTLVSEMAFPDREKRMRTSRRYGILQQEGKTKFRICCSMAMVLPMKYDERWAQVSRSAKCLPIRDGART